MLVRDLRALIDGLSDETEIMIDVVFDNGDCLVIAVSGGSIESRCDDVECVYLDAYENEEDGAEYAEAAKSR